MKTILQSRFLPMLYFKCSEGHYTPCRTGMQLFYCKTCNKLLNKKDCERFIDSKITGRTYKRGTRVLVEGKSLYKYTESVRRDYHRIRKEKRAAANMVECSYCGHDKLRHGLGQHSVRPGEGKDGKCTGCNMNCTKFRREG